MLERLLAAELTPDCIIEEDSQDAHVEKRKFEQRTFGEDEPPFLKDLAGEVPVYSVDNHNENDCLHIVKQYRPQWIILGGARIIRGSLLEFSLLNVHPGLLPWVRGSSPEAWSIYENLPVGVTCHRVDSGVDTGPFLIRRKLVVLQGDQYERIVRRNMALAANVMVEAIRIIASGNPEFVRQDQGVGKNYPVMQKKELEGVKRKLRNGNYQPQSSAW